jgi:hypothetical protein
MYKFIFILLLAVMAAPGQTGRVLKDHLGNPMLEVTMIPPPSSGDCSYLTCFVQGTIKWFNRPEAWLLLMQESYPQKVLAPGETTELAGSFLAPQTYSFAGDDRPKFRSIDLEMDHTFKSPQELEQEKKFAEDAAKTERDLKAACLGIYNRTIDKAAKDLTVREEMQIAYCKANGWY